MKKFRGYSPIPITVLIVMMVATSITVFALENLIVGVIISAVIGVCLLELIFDVTFTFKDDELIRRNGFIFTKVKFSEIVDVRKINLKAVGPCNIIAKDNKVLIALVFKQAEFNDELFSRVTLEEPTLDLGEI